MQEPRVFWRPANGEVAEHFAVERSICLGQQSET